MFGLSRIGLKERLANGSGLGVVWLALGSVPLVEVAARAGPDAFVFDLQHGLWDRSTLEAGIAAASHAAPVIVRTADISAPAIGQALDAGAEGVLAPLVETAEDAARVVQAAHYPPRGSRSGGGVRPLAQGFSSYRAAADARVTVGVMIETMRGVANAASIARTPGIDFVFIGTGDLALSLGASAGDGAVESACRTVLDVCAAAGRHCGIFTMSTELALRRRREGYQVVVVADDLQAVAQSISGAVRIFAEARRAPEMVGTGRSPSPPILGYHGNEGVAGMSAELLARLAAAIASGSVRVVDLTQTLQPSTPVIQLPPQFAPSNPFRIEEISHYDERGAAWYWNNISLGEHTGTHFDAPIHWVTGKNYADGATDTIAVQRFIAPACVIDCSREAAADEKFLLEPAHIMVWESRHGRIPKGAWVLMRTDWSKRTDPAAFLNMKEDGPHVPGPSAAAIRFLISERDVNGWGVEAIGTDAGQAFAFEPAFPAHHLMHGANKFGLASLTNLDKLPPTGAVLIAAPLKIKGGSGSPLRVLALIPG